MTESPSISSLPQKNCLQCGHCCGPYFELYVDEVDEDRWEDEGRHDILDRLLRERESVSWDDDGPFNVETKERFTTCFFMDKTEEGRGLCRIHFTKPKICRDYPPGNSGICVLCV